MSRRARYVAAALWAGLAATGIARAETVPLPAAPGEIVVAVLDSARDQDGWRLGVVRSRYAQVLTVGVVRADGGEDEYAFDCARGDYAYARRALTLAGVVVDRRDVPASAWASSRFPRPPKGSVPALALERFCALDVAAVR